MLTLDHPAAPLHLAAPMPDDALEPGSPAADRLTGGGAPQPLGYAILPWHTKDGTLLHIRHILPSDAERLVDMFYQLSERTLSLRFAMAMVNVPVTRVIREATRLAVIDPASADALVALEPVASGPEQIVGVARLAGATATTAEFAMTIRDDYQGRGVGSFLFDLLIQVALARGLHTLTASVLAENRPMLTLIRRSGMPTRIATSHGESEVTMYLSSEALPPDLEF